MIDIHCHALFDVDDGADSLEKSVAMLKKAAEVGIDKLILTPHYMEDGYKNEPAILKDKFEILKQKLLEEKVNIDIYRGEEVFAFLHMDEFLREDKILSLNNSKYVLVEFPLFEEFICVEEIIFRLTSMGIVPVIAHPERYLFTYKNFDRMYELVKQGALLQLNANSLVGRYGKREEKVAEKLLKNNLIHFVGSDAHSVGGFAMLDGSLSRLEKLVGKNKFDELTFKNQEKLLNDETILVDVSSKSFSGFKFSFRNLFTINK